jgi:hypothetical protein
VKAEDMQILLAKKAKRKHEDGRDTVIVINGVKIESSWLETFSKRRSTVTGVAASPSARECCGVALYCVSKRLTKIATPEGAEYYTPPREPYEMSNHSTPQRIVPCDNVLIDSSPPVNSKKDTEPKTVMYITSMTMARAVEENRPLQTHPFHQTGRRGAIGSGRFRDPVKLLRCFRGAIGVANALNSLMHADLTASKLPSRRFDGQFTLHGTP